MRDFVMDLPIQNLDGLTELFCGGQPLQFILH